MSLPKHFERARQRSRRCTNIRADEIVLLSYGAGKAGDVAKMIEGPVSAAWPASIFQMHPKVTVVLDEAAAGDLALRACREGVHLAGH